jgi:hypothetical protein
MKPMAEPGSPRQQGRGESAAESFGTARNRRTRTRMSGGVGAGRAILPATRLDDSVFVIQKTEFSTETTR